MSPLHYLSSHSDFGFEFVEIFIITPQIWIQIHKGSKCIVRDLCQTYLCKNLGKSASLPCPFNHCLFIVNHCLVIVNHCLVIVNHCLVIVNHCLVIVNHRLVIVNHCLFIE